MGVQDGPSTATGLTWDDLPALLRAPGTEIRGIPAGDLMLCLIRLEAGVQTSPLFVGLPDDRCQCAHWGYIINGTMRVHRADGTATYEAGESYYWPPGHNLEAVSDVNYLEISPGRDYRALMDHCRRKLAG